jgi:ankyrin repeat protein
MSNVIELQLAEAVEKSADINSLVMIQGRELSQLMVACYLGNIDYVEDLLKVPGVRVNLQNSEGQHALLCACEQGHTDIAQLILNTCQNPKDVVNLPDKRGRTPLLIASYLGHKTMLEVILKHKNGKFSQRQTGIIPLLVLNGAHVNMQDNDRWSLLMIASYNGHTEIVSLLLQSGAHVDMQNCIGSSSLILACKNGHNRVVSLLLQNGAHVDMQDREGLSPLMVACEGIHLEIVSLLLQYGACVNMQNCVGSSSLKIACQNGQNKVVSLLLQNGAHVDMRDKEGWSPLMIASQNGHIEIIPLLLQNSADVNMCNKGVSPLMMACHKGHTDIVSVLMIHGADATLRSAIGGISALHIACESNKPSIVKQLLSPMVVDLRDELGNTPLMVASSCGHDEVVKLLLEAGAQVNISNFSDYPSLHLPLHQIPLPEKGSTVRGSALDIAAITGHVEVVSLLLQHGAKIFNVYYLLRSITLQLAQAEKLFRDMSRKSSPDWEKYSAVIQLLFSHDSDLIERVRRTNPSTLYMACVFGVLEMISLLINLGMSVSDLYRTDDSGSSYWCNMITLFSNRSLSKTTSIISHLLQKVDWARVIRFLSENGLDVNCQDSFGTFALGIASRERHSDLVRLLGQCGADVNLQDKEGVCSLMVATSGGHLEICRHLLRCRAKVDLLDNEGWSSLMVAVAADNVDLVLLLLERGAQINLQDESGTSSLMLSCLAGYTRVTKVLLGHGADVNLQNSDGITALMMSCYNGHAEIVELLINSGADISTMTRIGMTALRVSTDNGHKDITKLLIEYGARHINPSRKRPRSEKDTPFFNHSMLAHIPDKQCARLDRIENILLTLLQLQGSNQAPALVDNLRKTESKPVLSVCLKVLIPIAHDWKVIGTLLEVEHNSLEAIKRDNMGICKDCLRDMLHQWLVRVSPPPTWEELAEAVEHTDETVARKIRKLETTPYK